MTEGDQRQGREAFVLFLVFLVLFTLANYVSAQAAVTKVGNGDDGRDLEGFERINSGKIFESRKKAVALLKRLNTSGIRGLGNLLPEVEKSEMYLAKKNGDDSVYARTFAEPYAPTRFYPRAKELDTNQLISLHIHEALHRALPESIRENENIVSDLTVIITSPESSYDRISRATDKHMSSDSHEAPKIFEAKATIHSATQMEVQKSERPASYFKYSYRSFNRTERSNHLSKLKSMHTMESFMFPFGSDDRPIGIGLGISLAGTDAKNELGPLTFSGRGLLLSSRDFNVGWWVDLSLNTLSNEQLRDSTYGRDTTTVGLSMRKDSERFYLENLLGYTFAGSKEQEIRGVNYKFDFGSVTSAKIRLGAKEKGFALGGFVEVLLSDHYRVNGGGTTYNSGRFNMISAGPEASFTTGEITFSVFGRYILRETQDVNYDAIGNLTGFGLGDGFVGASFAVNL